MTSLYSLRSTPKEGEYIVTKFDPDYNVDSLYALNATECMCPAGHKPKCRHRSMLPLFLAQHHVDDGWFLDWDTRLWRHPVGDPAPAQLADPLVLPSIATDSEIIFTCIKCEQNYTIPEPTDECPVCGWSRKPAAPPYVAPGPQQHVLYETSDADAPDVIKDRNGEVVLGLCRVCGRGEIELSEPCGPKATPMMDTIRTLAAEEDTQPPQAPASAAPPAPPLSRVEGAGGPIKRRRITL
jgi:hypothetical protein